MLGQSLKALVIATTLVFAGIAHAVTFEDETPFDQAAFDAAQKSGKPILVHITAAWCSVCAAQKKILAELRAEDRFKSLLVFNVDFDAQKKLVRALHATAQSTMVVFKGRTEVGFFSGDTRPKAVALLLSRAL